MPLIASWVCTCASQCWCRCSESEKHGHTMLTVTFYPCCKYHPEVYSVLCHGVDRQKQERAPSPQSGHSCCLLAQWAPCMKSDQVELALDPRLCCPSVSNCKVSSFRLYAIYPVAQPTTCAPRAPDELSVASASTLAQGLQCLHPTCLPLGYV